MFRIFWDNFIVLEIENESWQSWQSWQLALLQLGSVSQTSGTLSWYIEIVLEVDSESSALRSVEAGELSRSNFHTLREGNYIQNSSNISYARKHISIFATNIHVPHSYLHHD
jgi:hypothetical protein